MLVKLANPSTAVTKRKDRTYLIALILLLALSLLFSGCETTANSPRKTQSSFERLLDSVVRIDVRETSFRGGTTRIVAGVGSGVILSQDGIILTNAHVVSPRAVDIWVTLANLERVSARLLGWDHWTDLAAIQLDMEDVEKRGLRFSYASFGNSDDLVPGQTVFAVGTPHGLSRTVTKGIISNTNRYFSDQSGINGYETGYFNTWLQTDAAINPGNSGGPLVNGDGRVIGINTRTYLGAENLGFAIPSKTAEIVLRDLVESGEVERSYIGLVPGVLQDLESYYSLEVNQGLLVNSVDPGSPADQIGLRPSDIVLSINDEEIDGRFPEQIPPIKNFIAHAAIGSELQLEVRRNGSTLPLTVLTERLLSRVGEEWAFEKWGLSVREISRAYARENQLESDNGVVVIGTQSAFPADKAGLRRGDIISKVDNKELKGLDELKELYKGYEEEPTSILMETVRNRRVSFKILKP